MHCENTTFGYHSEFNEYIKVQGVISEDFFMISSMLGLENSYQKKKKYICMVYLKKRIQSIFNLMMILIIIWVMKD